MGKRERERLKTVPVPAEPPRPRKETDEIASERGLELLPERGGLSVLFVIRFLCLNVF